MVDQLLQTSSHGSPEFIPSRGSCLHAGHVPACSMYVGSFVCCLSCSVQVEERQEEAFPNWRKVAKEQQVQAVWLSAWIFHSTSHSQGPCSDPSKLRI